MMTDYTALSLEEQVAQLFMIGYEGRTPQPITRRFLAQGVGGVIFFRDNFEAPPGEVPASPSDRAADALSVPAIRVLLDDFRSALPVQAPPPLLGIDQEGGQVERLPHAIFPTDVTPRAVALSPEPEHLAQTMYGGMARRLAALGFNLDFFPTLDVNLNPRNPVIGVRSFGDDPETVWRLGRIAMAELDAAGIIPVGKHFPGHGNGTVDSHLDLPTLHFTPAELQPFRRAIEAGLPVMMVAHGFYPALQITPEERNLPSSASPAVIQGLLRERCGFQGVVMTDDLNMGAITKHRSPVEAAMAALRAGVDILLYRRSTVDEWAVYEAVLTAFRTGALPMALLQASLARIAALKARLLQAKRPPFDAQDWTAETCRRESDAVALASVSSLSGDTSSFLPLDPQAAVCLVHPDRADLGNYAWDVPSSPSLAAVFRQAGFNRVMDIPYPFKHALSVADCLEFPSDLPDMPDTIIFVAFNALLHPEQAALYARLKERFPQAALILVSAGMPEESSLLPGSQLHLALCSYRPASMCALARVLSSSNDHAEERNKWK
jgi:beta-N-acetylhexosaminidase